MVEQPKVGRPHKPEADRKVETVRVRMSALDRKRLEQAARGADEKLSEWCRKALLQALKTRR